MRSISGPHINTIMALMSPPIRAETKVSAPRIRAAPIEANSTTIQDIESFSQGLSSELVKSSGSHAGAASL